MKLKSLKLENFRQHEDSFLEFKDGITVINGANGSGKSTILEAITWAIYGIEAARGNKDTIRFNKAKPRSKVVVELVFALEDDVFRVVRYLDRAEIYLNGNAAPVATSQQEVTRYLTEKIGMTKNEFFNTYFTGQKELNFLKNQGATERRKFISKVLGYDRIREAQEAARADKNGLEKEISGMKQGLDDISAIKQEREAAEARLIEARRNLEEKQKSFDDTSDKLTKIEPEWEKMRAVKEAFDKYTWENKLLSQKKEDVEKSVLSLSEQVKTLEQKSEKLAGMAKIEDEYRELETKITEQEKLQEKDAIRQQLVVRLEGLEKSAKEKQSHLEEIVRSGTEKKAKIEKLPVLGDEINAINSQIQKVESDLAGQKREKEVLIRQNQAEIKRIQNQLALIEEKGEDGVCPTCERPLKDEFNKVTGGFKTQIEELSKGTDILRKELEAAAIESPELASLREQKKKKELELSEYTLIKGDYEAEKRRYLTVKAELDNCNKEIEKIRTELATLPEGFDMEMLRGLRAQITPLKKQFEEIISLRTEVASLEKIKNELKATMSTKTEVEEKQKAIVNDLNNLNYSEEQYKKTEQAYQETKDAFSHAREQLAAIRSDEKYVLAELDRIGKIEAANREKAELIRQKQEEADLLYELDRFYGQLWEKLNNSARPEISELASNFLSGLTDNRYSILELNEKYEICLHDDGEIKPVISGGEEDIVNLCIRLAISQIIAQRSGKSLSLLVLDEIFGSLDEARRANVIYLLRSLTGHFEQVILITHIDDIRDNIDNVINIEFDPERGCSKITVPSAGSVKEQELLTI